MAIPDYQSLMLPLLRLLDDDQNHASKDLVMHLAAEFGLSNEERWQLPPSGRQPLFTNRVSWATTYLAKAGLIERPARAHARITDRGRQALAKKPTRIDNAYLSRFTEFEEFRRRSGRQNGEASASLEERIEVAASQPLPPDEMMEGSYQRLRQALAQELIDRVKNAPPAFFENLVVDLLVAMGYGGSRRDAGQAVGRSGDEGIDGIIKEDRLGLDFVYIQAKRWDHPVSRTTVQAFAGSLEGQRARKGVLITTSRFTREAAEFVNRIEKRIVLIDGEQLADLMIDHGVGVADVATYQVKRVDDDYFGVEF
ncbi:MAG: restriction endonuclease [Chloroflexia bacterium]|nr:restriction endonuclease [Chloroflexia bacterium]